VAVPQWNTAPETGAGKMRNQRIAEKYRKYGKPFATFCERTAAFLEVGALLATIAQGGLYPMVNIAKIAALGLRWIALKLR
jgi:hypothetical protein